MGKITAEIKEQVLKTVNAFNEENKKLHSFSGRYVVTFKGKYIYINTFDGLRENPACRLFFEEDIDDLEFEIYKYSIDRYSDDTFMMPGEEFLDGTVSGALQCVFELYPPD